METDQPIGLLKISLVNVLPPKFCVCRNPAGDYGMHDHNDVAGLACFFTRSEACLWYDDAGEQFSADYVTLDRAKAIAKAEDLPVLLFLNKQEVFYSLPV